MKNRKEGCIWQANCVYLVHFLALVKKRGEEKNKMLCWNGILLLEDTSSLIRVLKYSFMLCEKKKQRVLYLCELTT